jgi:hypothetical protein
MQQFATGVRSGITPPWGTPHVHVIFPGAMLPACGASLPNGVELGSSILTTDISQITCGACLATLTQPPNRQL